jgi:hypothetical protein
MTAIPDTGQGVVERVVPLGVGYWCRQLRAKARLAACEKRPRHHP